MTRKKINLACFMGGRGQKSSTCDYLVLKEYKESSQKINATGKLKMIKYLESRAD